jgi:chorismate synthase
MADNSIGNIFRATCFGESHGNVIGVIVDGTPAGLDFEIETIQKELNLRKPHQSNLTSTREEEDEVVVLSGIFNHKTTGAPICMIIHNKHFESSTYERSKHLLRPSHVDYVSLKRFGNFGDYRGSGIFSGRLTAGFVMAGALAKEILATLNIKIFAYTRSISKLIDHNTYNEGDFQTLYQLRESSSVRALSEALSGEMTSLITTVKQEGDSVGGTIKCIIMNVPAGIGGPLFNSLESNLSKAMFSIPAVKGIEFGAGFDATRMRGSEHNDPWIIENGRIMASKNDSGGIIGGISTGMPIYFTIAIKPTASISKKQQTVNMESMKPEIIKIKGKHDPCIVPRAIVIVEAMAAITLVDQLMMQGIIQPIIKKRDNEGTL